MRRVPVQVVTIFLDVKGVSIEVVMTLGLNDIVDVEHEVGKCAVKGAVLEDRACRVLVVVVVVVL